MDLIKIESRIFGEGEVPTVNARELHGFLDVGKIFGAWIQERIDQFGFIENQDFVVCFPNLESKGRGGHNAKEYHLTIDMAKELSMVERNEKGKQARQYFIECERRAKNPAMILEDPKAMRNLLLTYTEKVLSLQETVREKEEKIELDKPKVSGFDRIATSDGAMCITDAAKTLQVQPKMLFKWLFEKEWIYRRNGSKNWVAHQTRLRSGVMAHKTTTFQIGEGEEKTVTQALITPKGLTKLAESLFSKMAA